MTAPLPTVQAASGAIGYSLPHVMKNASLSTSTSEAMRLIKQGGVKVDGEVFSDPAKPLPSGEHIIQVGKKKIIKVDLPPL
jgi:tyrosyl-tRNA synthetase